ncbi:hypothetical protein, variant [Phialophora macrospora]|uniref:Opsin-1 n=1 Tax=Phialophora macrospora TaxID=1851006 RepID=A0A0D2GJG4_9EURO|nr:hypothetical protein, variant [Phialophora macrospora]
MGKRVRRSGHTATIIPGARFDCRVTGQSYMYSYLLLVSWSTLSSSHPPSVVFDQRQAPSQLLICTTCFFFDCCLEIFFRLIFLSCSSKPLHSPAVILHKNSSTAYHTSLAPAFSPKPNMIISPEMIKTAPTASTSVAPIPTVVPTPPQVIAAGDAGNRTLWVVVVIMAISSLAFYGMAFRVPVQKRLFHIITAFITTFAFLSYFAMATGDGTSFASYTKTEHHKKVPSMDVEVKREIYWARYVDWSITTPLLLLDLALLAGLSGANILVAIVADVIMVLTGLFAAFGQGKASQKWGWYAWGCIAYLVVVYQLAIGGRETVARKDSKTKAFYASIAGYTLILWTMYPIIWGLSEGGHVINVDSEIIAYAVLDVLAKPVFGFWLLFTHDSMASTSPSLEGFWAHGFGEQGTLRVGDED